MNALETKISFVSVLFYEKLYAKEIENQFWDATENIDTHNYVSSSENNLLNILGFV